MTLDAGHFDQEHAFDNGSSSYQHHGYGYADRHLTVRPTTSGHSPPTCLTSTFRVARWSVASFATFGSSSSMAQIRPSPATTCALIEVYMPALPCHIPETDTNAGTSSTINQHPHPFLRLSWLPWRIHCHTSGKESRSTRTWIALLWNALTHTSTTAHVYPVCILSVIKLQYKSCSCVGLKECHRKVLCFSHRFLKHPDGVPICGFLPVPLPPTPFNHLRDERRTSPIKLQSHEQSVGFRFIICWCSACVCVQLCNLGCCIALHVAINETQRFHRMNHNTNKHQLVQYNSH